MSRDSALGREISQSRPFRSASQEAMLGVLRTADVVRRRVSRCLEPFGITHQQYNVLRILRGAGDDGLATLAIAERMLERTPGITRLLDRLVAKRWVVRKRLTDDRRRVQCWISPTGLELLAELDAPIDALHERMQEILGDDDARRLIELLDRIRQAPG